MTYPPEGSSAHSNPGYPGGSYPAYPGPGSEPGQQPPPFWNAGGQGPPPPYSPYPPAPPGPGGGRHRWVLPVALLALLLGGGIVLLIALGGGGDDEGDSQANRAESSSSSEEPTTETTTGGGLSQPETTPSNPLIGVVGAYLEAQRTQQPNQIAGLWCSQSAPVQLDFNVDQYVLPNEAGEIDGESVVHITLTGSRDGERRIISLIFTVVEERGEPKICDIEFPGGGF